MKIRRKAGAPRKADTWEGLERLLEQGIKPVADELAVLLESGLIPVVVFEPGEKAQQALGMLFPEWKPETRLFGITRENFARTLGQIDHVTEAWGSRARPAGDFPIFVFMHEGTLLVNYVYDEGFSLEPGSLDSDRAAWCLA